ncbi:WD40 repeat-like protein, partial [Cryphonectria parasitica EP155]
MYKVTETGVDRVDHADRDNLDDREDRYNSASDSSSTANTTGRKVHLLMATVLSHDGLRAATANEDGEVQLWNIASHGTDATLWRTMRGLRSEVNWLSFSSDDALLLACLDNGQTDVWDTDTGKRVAVLGGHSSWVHFAAFAPDDKLVATASYDGLVRLWDLAACRAM